MQSTCKLNNLYDALDQSSTFMASGFPSDLIVAADRKRAPPDPNEPTCCGLVLFDCCDR